MAFVFEKLLLATTDFMSVERWFCFSKNAIGSAATTDFTSVER